MNANDPDSGVTAPTTYGVPVAVESGGSLAEDAGAGLDPPEVCDGGTDIDTAPEADGPPDESAGAPLAGLLLATPGAEDEPWELPLVAVEDEEHP